MVDKAQDVGDAGEPVATAVTKSVASLPAEQTAAVASAEARALEPSTAAIELLGGALGVPSPFPWQVALLQRFVAGDLPRALDIPTGLGKTAVMAIWLLARALGASLPRRLVYVVDRRAVVDQATEVAESLRAWLERTPNVAGALRLAADGTLPISTLRGQFADNKEWLSDPSATAIVVGTVDMVGSRLLFEGYGVSRKMRPYHAGMLGADTLVVLDEAHLVPPFEAMLETIYSSPELAASDPALRSLIPPLRLLSLSATGKATEATFRLTPDDETHPGVRKRLDAAKSTWLRDPIDPEETELHDALAEEAWLLSEEGTKPMRVIVFCNSRVCAQKVQERLNAKATKARLTIDCDLFVGGRRVHEREEASKWLRERGFLAGSAALSTRPAFLIATSAGEVGVDLDADHMVSDVVAWERMVQRLGRVNRRGEGDARVIVVPSGPSKAYREALEKDPADRKPQDLAVLARQAMLDASLHLLQHLPRRREALDASPGALGAVKVRARSDHDLAALLAAATTPKPLHPALSLALVESWSMTSLEEHTGRPEVEPWIRGWVEQEPQTTIVWRAHLPVSRQGAALKNRLVEAFFDAAAPHLLEQLEAETLDAVTWLCARLKSLGGRAPRVAGDVAPVPQDALDEPPARDEQGAPDEEEGLADPHDEPEARPEGLVREHVIAFLRSRDGTVTPLRGTLLDPKEAREQLLRDLRGATLIVDARLGGLRAGLLDEDCSSAVMDVGEARTDLPFRVRATGTDDSRQKDWFEELRVVTDATAEGEPQRWLVVERSRRRSANTEEGRSISRAQTLNEHQSWAEREASELARRLRLPAPYDSVLALAARLHDEGKQAAVWQRAFHAPTDTAYAKTTSRPNVALLDGYRHELGSLPHAMKDARVRALDPALRDLCLHLIAAHHGFARPIIRTSGCQDAPPSALVERAQEIALRFTDLEERWGPWGLAWWESLLRAADQEASRQNDLAGEVGATDHG